MILIELGLSKPFMKLFISNVYFITVHIECTADVFLCSNKERRHTNNCLSS